MVKKGSDGLPMMCVGNWVKSKHHYIEKYLDLFVRAMTKKWSDWVDYWAVDFNYESKKEIICIGNNDEAKEVWTGNYIFENEWQAFRTKRNRSLDLESIKHEYQKPGRHKIAVRVVDILGQDTLQIVSIDLS